MSSKPELDNPNVPLAAAAKICRVEAATARWWFAQNHILLGQHDLPPEFPGDTSLITGRRVLQLAIGAALTVSMAPKVAFNAAWEFSDRGPEGGKPGVLSAKHQTLLIADPETGAALCCWPGDRLKDVLEAFSNNPLVMCHLDPIVTTTMRSLVHANFLEDDTGGKNTVTFKKRASKRSKSFD